MGFQIESGNLGMRKRRKLFPDPIQLLSKAQCGQTRSQNNVWKQLAQTGEICRRLCGHNRLLTNNRGLYNQTITCLRRRVRIAYIWTISSMRRSGAELYNNSIPVSTTVRKRRLSWHLAGAPKDEAHRRALWISVNQLLKNWGRQHG